MKPYIIIISILLCFALVFVLAFSAPIRYLLAGREYEQGNYEAARARFAELDYEDSETMLSLCDYHLALERMQGGDYDGAEQAFLSLGDLLEAEALSIECRRLSMLNALETGDYDKARSLALTLKNEEGARETLLECDYVQAKELLKQGKLSSAIAILSELDYKDSAEICEGCRDELYNDSIERLYSYELDTAEEGFLLLGDYKLSDTYLKFIRDRRRYELGKELGRVIGARSNSIEDFEKGKLYRLDSGIVYIPDECNRDTKISVYYAGGLGETLLYTSGVWEYFGKFQPNAIMLFFYESGFMHMHDKNSEAIELVNRLSFECGIIPHDILIAGSSHGCFTALHAAEQFYSEGFMPVKNALMLDAGSDWHVDVLLDEHERRELSRAGTRLYLFEQPDVEYSLPEIKSMTDSGIDVVLVACTNYGHNEISVDAYSWGLFSFGLGEYSELDKSWYEIKKP